MTELFGVWYLVSAIMAFVIKWPIVFLLQKSWTFRNKDQEQVLKQAFQYAALVLGLFLANLLMLYILVDRVGIWYVYAQVMATIVLGIVNYISNSYIFRNQAVTPSW